MEAQLLDLRGRQDHNSYYVNIAWDGFQRCKGAHRPVRGTSAGGVRG